MKPDILEHKTLADRLREGQRIFRREDFRLDLEKGEQVIEIKRLARRGRKAREQPFEKIAQTPERAREERKIAHREFARQRAPGDIGIGQVIAHGADCGEQPAPAGAPHRQPAIGRIEGGGKLHIAVDQEAVEAEDFHFLGGFNAGRRLPAHNPFRAAPACGRNRANSSAR